jgi:hypothetical protein
MYKVKVADLEVIENDQPRLTTVDGGRTDLHAANVVAPVSSVPTALAETDSVTSTDSFVSSARYNATAMSPYRCRCTEARDNPAILCRPHFMGSFLPESHH